LKRIDSQRKKADWGKRIIWVILRKEIKCLKNKKQNFLEK
jgi:hypothetical protein